MSVIRVTKENFSEIVEKEGVRAIVDFYADWCGPCKMFAPLFESISGEVEDVVFCKINVDDDQELAIRFGVMSIPTVIAFKDGKAVAQNVGLAGKQKILEMLS